MAMKRLSSLMLRKWKEKERWTGRRRSEPYGGGEQEEDEEERQTDRRDRQTHKRMLRRKSEPCGLTEEDEKMEEKKTESSWKKERQKSESIMEEEDRKKQEEDRDRRRWSKEKVCIMGHGGGQSRRTGGQEAEGGRQTDAEAALRTMWHPACPTVSCVHRKRKELLHRRTGRRMEEGGQTDGEQRDGFRQMTRGRSEPTGPLDKTYSTSSRPPPSPPPRQEEVSSFHLETYLTEPRRPETRRLRSFSSPPDPGQRSSTTSTTSCFQPPPPAPPRPVRRL
ncbi:hypothetical protein E3U43_016767, partial [Larimichthys crocea]